MPHLPRPVRALAVALVGCVGLAVPAVASAQAVAPPPPAATPRVTDGAQAPFFEFGGAALNVGGTYTPVVGDWAADGQDDILWYAPGTGAEQLWTSNGVGGFSKAAGPRVDGTFTPIVGQFGGSDRDDILWYGKGSAPDRLWIQTAARTFQSHVVTVDGSFEPVKLHNDSGPDDIAWWSPGATSVPVWAFTGTGAAHASTKVAIPAGTRPLVGNFAGSADDDVFWYGPGAVPDRLTTATGGGSFTTTAQNVSGTYQPVVGRIGNVHDSLDDILWYGANGLGALWASDGDGTWTGTNLDLPAGVTPISIGGGRTVYLRQPGTRGKTLFMGADGPSVRTVVGTHAIGAGHQPIQGQFLDGMPDLFWYQAGPTPEYLWEENIK